MLGRMPPGTALDLHAKVPFQFTTLSQQTRPWPIVQGTFDQPPMQERAIQLWASIRQQLSSYITSGERIISLYAEASRPTATVEDKQRIAGELRMMNVDPATLARSLTERRRAVDAWKSRRDAMDVTTKQGRTLAEQRAEEEEVEEE